MAITSTAVSSRSFKICSKLVLLILVLTVACGCGDGEDPAVAADPGYDAIKPTVDRVCGPCHNGADEQAFDAARFRTSGAKARIQSGSMPPGGGISSGERKILLDYLNS